MGAMPNSDTDMTTTADAHAATLRDGFVASAARWPDRPAMWIAGVEWSYAAVASLARRWARTLHEASPDDDPPLTAVLAYRSPAMYVGVMAALMRGHGYVPLNPTFPPQRTAAMLSRSEASCVIVDDAGAKLLDDVLAGVDRPLTLLLPDAKNAAAIAELASRWPKHRWLTTADVSDDDSFEAPAPSPDDIAYLLFTSGSTGVPKGVMVAHRNIHRFIDVMAKRYGIDATDRFTQMFDTTFDLSLFDLFVAWERGACVCAASRNDTVMPARYIADSGVTVWFSVPSTAVLMKRFRMLEPGAYPTLRWALFCGEALTASIAEAFDAAAPNAIVENLYGPTEVTLACTLYRWDAERSPGECVNGVVPIGEPYDGMTARIVDEHLRDVPNGTSGELLMAGPQVAPGYWRDAERTAAAFVTPPGSGVVHYRTGDLVRRDERGGPICYLGRIDDQLQVRGYRVELGEVEAALREATGAETAIAVGWPTTESGADGVVAFVSRLEGDAAAVRQALGERLPGYMVPTAIHAVDRFPLNANGKVDRKALLARLG